MVGVEARCVDASASRFWQNAECLVEEQEGEFALCSLPSTGVKKKFRLADLVALDKPKTLTIMPNTIDLRRMTKIETERVLKATGQSRATHHPPHAAQHARP